MKRLIILLAALLLLGCTGERGAANPANATTNQTNVTSGNATGNSTNVSVASNASNHTRFMAASFSFDYPPNLTPESLASAHGGFFSAKHELADRTGEFLVVVFDNTSATYGANAESEFQANPGLAAARFLISSESNDSAGLLGNATETGATATFAIGRDAFVAEVPFVVEYPAGTYAGYALSMYVPARSLEVQARILALDPAIAKQMRDEFLLSFRVE